MQSAHSPYRDILTQSLPLVFSQCLIMLTITADVVMVGRLGEMELAALSSSFGLHQMVFFLFYGCNSVMNALFGYANGMKNFKEIRVYYYNGLWITLVNSLIAGTFIIIGHRWIFSQFGFSRELTNLASEYLTIFGLVFFPLLYQIHFRSFHEGVIRPKRLLFFNIAGMLMNICLNWLLIYGNMGFPALGLQGAAMATLISQWTLVLAQFLYIQLQPEFKGQTDWDDLKVDWKKIRRVIRLGFPAGGSTMAESGMFNITALFLGVFGAVELAGHQIAFNAIANMFMIPLGISFSVSALVANREGEYGRSVSVLYAKAAFWIAVGVMTCQAAILFFFNDFIPYFYTDVGEVVMRASELIILAAIFQISDGMQVITAGILRGYQATGRAMAINLTAYMGIGTPIGYWLGIVQGMGAKGFWIGFIFALTFSAVGLNILLRFVIRAPIR